VLFFLILIIFLIFEGPWVLLILAALAPKLGLSFWHIYLLSVLGDLLGDVMRYGIGRYANNLTYIKQRVEKLPTIKLIDEKIENNKLLDVLILVKYSPIVATLGLMYLGYKKIDFKQFLIYVTVMIAIYSFILSFVGYYFGKVFAGTDNFSYFVIGLSVGIIILYFLTRRFSRLLLRKITR
jgi:membrane protein DedA with SNARE-associated domain